MNSLAQIHQSIHQVVTEYLYFCLYDGRIIRYKTSEANDTVNYRFNQVCGLYPSQIEYVNNDREALAKMNK